MCKTPEPDNISPDRSGDRFNNVVVMEKGDGSLEWHGNRCTPNDVIIRDNSGDL